MRDRPATTFISADGVNGKQNMTKIGANPFLSIHPIAFRTFSCLFTKEKRLRPKWRIMKRQVRHPLLIQAKNKENRAKIQMQQHSPVQIR